MIECAGGCGFKSEHLYDFQLFEGKDYCLECMFKVFSKIEENNSKIGIINIQQDNKYSDIIKREVNDRKVPKFRENRI